MLPGSVMSYLEVCSVSVQRGKDHVPESCAAHLRSDLTCVKWGRLFVISLNERRSAVMNWAFGSTETVQWMQRSEMSISKNTSSSSSHETFHLYEFKIHALYNQCLHYNRKYVHEQKLINWWFNSAKHEKFCRLLLLTTGVLYCIITTEKLSIRVGLVLSSEQRSRPPPSSLRKTMDFSKFIKLPGNC